MTHTMLEDERVNGPEWPHKSIMVIRLLVSLKLLGPVLVFGSKTDTWVYCKLW